MTHDVPHAHAEKVFDLSPRPSAFATGGGGPPLACSCPRATPPSPGILRGGLFLYELHLLSTADLLLHYRQLERAHREKLPGTSFIQFLCATFWQTWVPTLGVSDKWETIYRRDRYRCTSPVCHQRNVTLHHVQYRANGGTDAPDNLTSPCAFCHLEGEHAGRLKTSPPAPT